MIGSFTIFDCSEFEGALAWGVAWKPEGGEWSEPSGYLQMTEGRLFENVGLTGQLVTSHWGGEGVFPNPGPTPGTTWLQSEPLGPFTLEDGKSYCINAQTGVLTEMAPAGVSIIISMMPLIVLGLMFAMMRPMVKEIGAG